MASGSQGIPNSLQEKEQTSTNLQEWKIDCTNEEKMDEDKVSTSKGVQAKTTTKKKKAKAQTKTTKVEAKKA